MHKKSDESQFLYYFYTMNAYSKYSGYHSSLTLKLTQQLPTFKGEKMYFYVL